MSKNNSNGVVDNAKIAVIGLGYVGLPLAIEFGKKYDVLGFDINQSRVDELSQGKDRTQEANLEDIRTVIDSKKTKNNIGPSFSANKEEVKHYSTFIVTVPTPIHQFKPPDLTPLIKASEM